MFTITLTYRGRGEDWVDYDFDERLDRFAGKTGSGSIEDTRTRDHIWKRKTEKGARDLASKLSKVRGPKRKIEITGRLSGGRRTP